MSNTNDQTGLARFVLRKTEREHFLVKRFEQALREERETLRTQLEHPGDIAATTLLRGQITLLKRILARLDEVGPESRLSEALSPESAPPAPTAGGFPVSFVNDETR
jgi:hypothetical protein